MIKRIDLIYSFLLSFLKGYDFMKNKKIVFWGIGIAAIFISIFLFFFIKNFNKQENLGNNITNNMTMDQIKEYILNISSYEAKMEVEIKTNKNQTKYKITQKYQKPNLCSQVVEEPSNIKGLKTTYDGKDLKVENTRLNLSTVYENYPYLTENNLWLNSFIDDFLAGEGKIEEKNGEVILETKARNKENIYQVSKTLTIDSKSAKPIKLEIKDNNQNLSVYILYNEIKINHLKGEDALAFKVMDRDLEI